MEKRVSGKKSSRKKASKQEKVQKTICFNVKISVLDFKIKIDDGH